MSATLNENRRPKVGDHAWHLDWCAGITGLLETPEDPVRHDYKTELFWTLHEAVVRAEEVKTLDYFGVSVVTPVRFEHYEELDARKYPHAGYWKPCGEKVLFET